MSSVVHTVHGPVAADELGFTLPHEHTFTNWHHAPWYTAPLSVDDFAEELEPFVEAGGNCLVDLTVGQAGRDPVLLRELSNRTGLHIVTCTGFYTEDYLPASPDLGRLLPAAIARTVIEEFDSGIGDTGIRPGIIKVSATKQWVSPLEERLHRAVARAHFETDLAITTHSLLSDVGLQQLDIFEEEGVDPDRVVIGHCNSYPNLDYYKSIIARGAHAQFDMWGSVTHEHLHIFEPKVFDLLLELLDLRYEGQILLSHDVGYYGHLAKFGGNGYTYLHRELIPRLKSHGVDDSLIDKMTVHNPRRVLGVSEA